MAPDIDNLNGVDMADIASINGQDAPSGGGSATTTPTGNISAQFGYGTVTVTNHASAYTNPNYSCSCSVDGGVIAADSVVDHTLDSGSDSLSAVMTFQETSTSTNERTVTVTAQEYGSAQSSALTLNYTPSYTAYRYIRISNVLADGSMAGGASWFAIKNARFFTAPGNNGTEYPTTDVTSGTSETGIAITGGDHYGGDSYLPWKTYDSSTSTYFWVINSPGTHAWVTMEFEPATYDPPPTIKSFNLNIQYGMYVKVEGSDDNANWTELAMRVVDDGNALKSNSDMQFG